VRVDTDYLVVGAGASGLAFTDALVAEADVEVTVIDRRHAPGGHWVDAYPFVRLHTPSANYGVNSLALGEDRIDEAGENAGYYERATGGEVREYFAAVVARLIETGRVRLLTGHEHLSGANDVEQIRDLSTGELRDVAVRRRLVDARYLEASIPATHRTPFEVAPSARVVPVNDLPGAARSASRYAVFGSGKTAADACIWLLDNAVAPDQIRWIRPRDAWFNDRSHFQPLEQVGSVMEGIAHDAEAGALATSMDDLFERLEAFGRVVRIDPSWSATMYRGTMLSPRELEALRQITDVVRLGRVRRIEAHRIVLQQVRHLSPSFNAALVGFVEAHRDNDVEKNRLCPPNPYASRVEDWPRMISRTWRTEMQWSSEPDVAAWVAGSRLNLLRALPDHAVKPSVQASAKRYLTHVKAAIDQLTQLDRSVSRVPRAELR
jgi:hypothetical protein